MIEYQCPKLRQIGNTLWVLEESIKIFGYNIPKNFLTDLRSFLNNGKEDHYTACWLLHDWFYRSQIVKKVHADYILKILLIQYGMPEFEASIVHKSLKRFGWFAWYKNMYKKYVNPEWYIYKS